MAAPVSHVQVSNVHALASAAEAKIEEIVQARRRAMNAVIERVATERKRTWIDKLRGRAPSPPNSEEKAEAVEHLEYSNSAFNEDSWDFHRAKSKYQARLEASHKILRACEAAARLGGTVTVTLDDLDEADLDFSSIKASMFR